MPFLSFGVYYIDPLTGDTTVINDPSILSLSFIGQIVSGRSLVYKLPLPIKQCNNDSSISPFCFDF
jgi:hypothetical protein